MVAVRNRRREDLGNEANADLFAQLTEVRTALMGWMPKPPSGDVPPALADFEGVGSVDLVSGALLAYDAATVWWQDTYDITYWSRR